MLSMEWFYVTSVMVTKFALLLLYLRVFAVSTRFRLTVYFVATTVALWAIVLYIVLVRYCSWGSRKPAPPPPPFSRLGSRRLLLR